MGSLASALKLENVGYDKKGPIAYVTLNRPKVMNALNKAAINELRAQLSEGLARLDQLTVGLQAVQEFLWPMQAPGQPDHEAASPADNSSDPGGDSRA